MILATKDLFVSFAFVALAFDMLSNFALFYDFTVFFPLLLHLYIEICLIRNLFLQYNNFLPKCWYLSLAALLMQPSHFLIDCFLENIVMNGLSIYNHDGIISRIITKDSKKSLQVNLVTNIKVFHLRWMSTLFLNNIAANQRTIISYSALFPSLDFS